MNMIQRFFWICSGASLGILKKCPSEANKYIGIGATIFFTGLLAAISASYALYTVFGNVIIAIVFGLVWGAMIFNLDRYLVSSMKKNNNRWKEFLTALPRLLLAVLIAIVISKPLELKIFETEIDAELIKMEQAIYKEQEDLLNLRFEPIISSVNLEIQRLKAEIDAKTKQRDELQIIAQQEADGTGGSMQRNLGPIYKAKKADADNAELELKALRDKNETVINQLYQQLNDTDEQITNEITAMGRNRLNGMAARIDALSNLTKKSEAIYLANIFIILLFIAIETAPIFVKLISERGPYDDKIDAHERIFHVNTKEKVNNLDQQLKENTSLFNNESDNHIEDEVAVKNSIREEMLKAEGEVARKKIEHWKHEEISKLTNGQSTENITNPELKDKNDKD